MHCVMEDATICLTEPAATNVVIMATVHIVDKAGAHFNSAEYQIPILANDQLNSVFFAIRARMAKSVAKSTLHTRLPGPAAML